MKYTKTQNALLVDEIHSTAIKYSYPLRGQEHDEWGNWTFDRTRTDRDTNQTMSNLTEGHYYLVYAEYKSFLHPMSNTKRTRGWTWSLCLPISEKQALDISTYKAGLEQQEKGSGMKPLSDELTYSILTWGDKIGPLVYNKAKSGTKQPSVGELVVAFQSIEKSSIGLTLGKALKDGLITAKQEDMLKDALEY